MTEYLKLRSRIEKDEALGLAWWDTTSAHNKTVLWTTIQNNLDRLASIPLKDMSDEQGVAQWIFKLAQFGFAKIAILAEDIEA